MCVGGGVMWYGMVCVCEVWCECVCGVVWCVSVCVKCGVSV